MSVTDRIQTPAVLRCRKRSTALAVLVPAFIAIMPSANCDARSYKETSAKALLAAADGWTVQLQNLDVDRASRDASDVLLVDYSKDGTADEQLTRREVKTLKHKPDGTRRLVLSYLSIGEAESYRYYWNTAWTATDPAAPSWLHCENVRWKGNYLVRFWDQDWQRLIFGSPTSFLDRIIEAGFDGVSLDRADVYEYWQSVRAKADDDMVDFIARISAYARARNPNFLVILQNAEELEDHQRLRTSIDGIVKEELLYGSTRAEAPNSATEIETSMAYLKHAHAHGLPVFVVEYVRDKEQIRSARQVQTQTGFVMTFAPLQLDSLLPQNSGSAVPPTKAN